MHMPIGGLVRAAPARLIVLQRLGSMGGVVFMEPMGGVDYMDLGTPQQGVTDRRFALCHRAIQGAEVWAQRSALCHRGLVWVRRLMDSVRMWVGMSRTWNRGRCNHKLAALSWYIFTEYAAARAGLGGVGAPRGGRQGYRACMCTGLVRARTLEYAGLSSILCWVTPQVFHQIYRCMWVLPWVRR